MTRRLAPGPMALLSLGIALYAVPLLANLPLIDPDEGLHAAIAREMVDRADYVTPRVLGAPFLDKPILFFLAEALSIRAFGASEFAVRLPGQVLGLLGAITTGLVAGALSGQRAGRAAACVYATLAFPLALDQSPVHDVALVPWVNLAFASFLLAARGDRAGPTIAWCAGAGLWLGLAILTKGFVGVALVGLPVALLVAIERRLTRALVAGAVTSLVVAVLIALPWYLAMERAHPGYLRYFLLDRHLLGFATTTQIHGQRPWWYYGPILLAGSAPWIATVWAAWTRGPAPMAPALRDLRRVAAVWLVIDVMFLSLAGSKLATYVLPLYPAVALMTVAAWSAVPTTAEAIPGRPFVSLARAQALLGALMLPAAWGWAVFLLGATVAPVAGIGILLIALGWMWIAVGAHRWPIQRTFLASLTGVAAILVVAYAVLFPSIAPRYTARDLAMYFNERSAFPPRLLIVGERVGSLLFYLDPRLRQGLTADRVDGMALGPALIQGAGVPGTLIALPESAAARLGARVDLDRLAFDRAGRYRLYDARVLRFAPVRSP